MVISTGANLESFLFKSVDSSHTDKVDIKDIANLNDQFGMYNTERIATNPKKTPETILLMTLSIYINKPLQN